MSNLSLQTKRNIICYRTGTLLNPKYADRIKSRLAFSVHSVSKQIVLFIVLSVCQHNVISGMITERHNIVCRLIMKAIRKGSLAGCLVHMDAGSADRLAQQNLQIPERASNRIILLLYHHLVGNMILPGRLFDARLPVTRSEKG